MSEVRCAVEKTLENLKKFALEVALANPSLVNFHLWETKEGELIVEMNERVGKREAAAVATTNPAPTETNDGDGNTETNDGDGSPQLEAVPA